MAIATSLGKVGDRVNLEILKGKGDHSPLKKYPWVSALAVKAIPEKAS